MQGASGGFRRQSVSLENEQGDLDSPDCLPVFSEPAGGILEGGRRQVEASPSLSLSPTPFPAEKEVNKAHQSEKDKEKLVENDPIEIEDDEVGAENLKDATLKPEVNSSIRFMLKNGTTGQGKILSTQPKKKSKWKDWIHLQLVDKDKPSSMN